MKKRLMALLLSALMLVSLLSGCCVLSEDTTEKIYGKDNWSLDTILQEEGNIHLYEKLGYHRVGTPEKINDRMDIVFFEKD